jgi:hypothetical protein
MHNARHDVLDHDHPTSPAPDALRTGAVAEILGVPEHRLANLIRHRLIVAPPLVAGRRVWRRADVDAARRVLVERGAIPSMVAADTPSVTGLQGAGLDPADVAQDLADELDDRLADAGVVCS